MSGASPSMQAARSSSVSESNDRLLTVLIVDGLSGEREGRFHFQRRAPEHAGLSPQAKADRAFGSGRIHHPAALHDFNFPRVNEPPCRAAGVFHVLPPFIGKLFPCGFAWADRRIRCALSEQGEDRFFERPVGCTGLPFPARIGTVFHLIPTTLPFLPPLDATAAGGAGFFVGHDWTRSQVGWNAQGGGSLIRAIVLVP
jgi:hypothetical protein